jgi:hypothetical protein
VLAGNSFFPLGSRQRLPCPYFGEIMSQATGFVYTVRLAPTALTTAKTLIQIKAGNAAIELLGAKIYQVTKTTSELLAIQILRKSAAATVTAFTPLKVSPANPSSLAVGGTTATGVTATAEGTDGDILEEDVWNVINGSWSYLPIPEQRIWVPASGIVGLKLNTAPAASMSVGAVIYFIEYQ